MIRIWLGRLLIVLAVIGVGGLVATMLFIPHNHTHRVRALVILAVTITSLVTGGLLGFGLLIADLLAEIY